MADPSVVSCLVGFFKVSGAVITKGFAHLFTFPLVGDLKKNMAEMNWLLHGCWAGGREMESRDAGGEWGEE